MFSLAGHVYKLDEGSGCGRSMCLDNRAIVHELNFTFLATSSDNLVPAFDLRTTRLSSGTDFSERIVCP